MDKRLEDLNTVFRDSHLYSTREFPGSLNIQTPSSYGNNDSGFQSDNLQIWQTLLRKPVLVETITRSVTNSAGIIKYYCPRASDAIKHLYDVAGRQLGPFDSTLKVSDPISSTSAAVDFPSSYATSMFQLFRATPVYEFRYYGQIQLIGAHYCWFYPIPRFTTVATSSTPYASDGDYSYRLWQSVFSPIAAGYTGATQSFWTPDTQLGTTTPWQDLITNARLAWQTTDDIEIFTPSHNKLVRIKIPWTHTRPMVVPWEDMALGTLFLSQLTPLLAQDNASSSYTIQVWRYYEDFEVAGYNVL
uniref:Uncharacterized protein n=1 Tax=Laksystermes virus TaxID=2796606 RepID=A0A7T7K8U7_9VIRU|nr:hypothetical protein 1 [Laksystermes virus]